MITERGVGHHEDQVVLALVGDAGYCPSPLSGLGTSLAIVGAYVLAGELAAAGGDYGVGFARYEDELGGYVKQCQDLPPGGIDGLPRTRMAIWVRNQSMRMMISWPWRGVIARTFQKADSISLKDYAGAAVLEAGLRP